VSPALLIPFIFQLLAAQQQQPTQPARSDDNPGRHPTALQRRARGKSHIITCCFIILIHPRIQARNEEQALQRLTELTTNFPEEPLNAHEQRIVEYTIKRMTSHLRDAIAEAERTGQDSNRLKALLRELLNRIQVGYSSLHRVITTVRFQGVVEVLNDHVSDEDQLGKILYLRILADLERYRIDSSTSQQNANAARERAQQLYDDAKRYSRDVDPSELVCLQLALNYSAFQHDYLHDTNAAYRTVREVSPIPIRRLVDIYPFVSGPRRRYPGRHQIGPADHLHHRDSPGQHAPMAERVRRRGAHRRGQRRRGERRQQRPRGLAQVPSSAIPSRSMCVVQGVPIPSDPYVRCVTSGG
jgi:hypothetical protein